MRAVRFFKGLSPVAQLLGGCVAAIAVHSASVELFRIRSRIDPAFSVGSADEFLTNSLSTGDIVMFSRCFYQYHLPVALVIRMRQLINESEFDHSGVIVMKAGVPYVIERTPFQGIKCRPFEERVRRSLSTHIVVIPAEKDGSFSGMQKYSIQSEVTRLTQHTGVLDSEVVRFWLGTISLILDTVSGNKEGKRFYCADSELIQGVWATLGYQVKLKSGAPARTATLRTFHDREVYFEFGNESTGERVRLAPTDVLIRSS